MSLFGTIQLANNALQAQQIGLQVAGQNIANANTPGYSREEVILTPAPTQQQGRLLLGLGVQVDGIVQKIDEFLEQRLRFANSDVANVEVQEKTYSELESILGELSDTDLSTSVNKFFSSISDVLNQPNSDSVRNLAVLQGRTLTGEMNRLSARVTASFQDLNVRIGGLASNINRLLTQVRDLNVRIASVEGGSASGSDAVGLRDQRNRALTDLSQLIGIRVDEQTSGAVNVFSNGEFLVFEGTVREIKAETSNAGDRTVYSLEIGETGSVLSSSSGELAGLTQARDQILGGFLTQLDTFADTLAFEFNRVFSSGQGVRGYGAVTGTFVAGDPTKPLDAAGLIHAPNSGSFEIQVFNRQTKTTQKRAEIAIDLNGLDDNDTTLDSLVAQLNAVDGVKASITPEGKLSLASTSSNLELAFGNDTSGVLAALGINTFFTGASAAGIGVNVELVRDPGKFAASNSGIGGSTGNALLLANFIDRPLDSADGASLNILQDRMTGSVTQGAAVAKAVAEGFRTFQGTLKGQQLATSGVSLDEEAVRMITYQRAYQATARLISTLDGLLQILVNL